MRGVSNRMMIVDVVPFKHMAIALAFGISLLVASIIAGACGPESKTHIAKSAYECPDHEHMWSDRCTGVKPSEGDVILVESPPLKSENRFWALVVTPYNDRLLKGQDTETYGLAELTMVVNVSSRQAKGDPWVFEAKNTRQTVKINCPITVKGKEDVPCEAVTVAFDEDVDATFHRIDLVLSMVSDDLSPKISLGDVVSFFSYGTQSFANFGIAYNLIFLVFSLVAFLFYLYRMRGLIFHGWTYEQIWTIVLGLAVIFYNNPLFALEYAAPGWFFPFLNALVKDFFLALLIIFWLLTVEKYRDLDEFVINQRKHGIKIVVAGVFLIFSIITFSWSVIAMRENPVLSSPFEVPGVVVMYVITVLILVGAMSWYSFISFFAVRKIANSGVMFTRFLFLSVPAAVVVLSMLIGACCGNFGTISTSSSNSLATAYFITLYNVYVWLLMFGYWPTASRSDAGSAQIIEPDPTEGKPILSKARAEEVEEDKQSPEQIA